MRERIPDLLREIGTNFITLGDEFEKQAQEEQYELNNIRDRLDKYDQGCDNIIAILTSMKQKG